MKIPKAIDYHKLDKRQVPNCLGIFYVLFSVIGLFSLHYFGVKEALPLASVILIGGFLGLVDDIVNIPWRYKVFMPLIAAIPLIVMRQGITTMATYFWGKIDFGIFYYWIIIPIIVMVVTNTVNMLGGLNGLETIPPLIIMLGFGLISNLGFLLLVPILVLAALASGNFFGKFFIGNVGSFGIGLTIASFGIVANIEQMMAFSFIPYFFNSAIILLCYIILHEKAGLELLQTGKLTSHKRRSLLTILAHNTEVSERRLVLEISLLILFYTFTACVLVGIT